MTDSMSAFGFHAGAAVGRYGIVRLIGCGATGVVYEAVDQSLGRRVALKVLRAFPEEGISRPQATERFAREGRAAAQIRHAHVVNIFDLGMQEGLPFLVMELVDGESLAQLLRRESKLSVERAAETLLPILSAVAQLHATGIVHRDIKPANILLSRSGEGPKLADFGVSRFEDDPGVITRSGAVIGTPEYMAPEMLRGQAATAWSDQYALGATLYECATGEKPFHGATEYELMHAVVSAPLPAPSLRDPALPRAFDEVVLRAMHRTPAQRFPSVDELAQSLLPFASETVRARWRSEFAPSGVSLQWETDTVARRPSPARREMRGYRHPHRVTGSVAVLCGIAALAAFGLGTRRHLSPAGDRSVAALPENERHPPSYMAVPASVAPATLPSARAAPSVATTREPRAPVAVPRAKPTPSAAVASSSASASPLVRGDNESPILDVP